MYHRKEVWLCRISEPVSMLELSGYINYQHKHFTITIWYIDLNTNNKQLSYQIHVHDSNLVNSVSLYEMWRWKKLTYSVWQFLLLAWLSTGVCIRCHDNSFHDIHKCHTMAISAHWLLYFTSGSLQHSFTQRPVHPLFGQVNPTWTGRNISELVENEGA